MPMRLEIPEDFQVPKRMITLSACCRAPVVWKLRWQATASSPGGHDYICADCHRWCDVIHIPEVDS
jgi:hypothetical protein